MCFTKTAIVLVNIFWRNVMNRLRRARLKEAADIISEMIEILDDIGEDEENYVENMPENLHGSQR